MDVCFGMFLANMPSHLAHSWSPPDCKWLADPMDSSSLLASTPLRCWDGCSALVNEWQRTNSICRNAVLSNKKSDNGDEVIYYSNDLWEFIHHEKWSWTTKHMQQNANIIGQCWCQTTKSASCWVIEMNLPSGKPLHNYGKAPHSMDKSAMNGHFP